MVSIVKHLCFVFALSTAFPLAGFPQGETDLTNLSLESLMQIRVTSVSRREEELRKTAAAVYVITQDDIRRSGITDVAELLRMVPGADVAHITSNTWAVSVRGFNAQYAMKLLVLIDGRIVYDPDFSGVYWHMQNLVLEDIDRVEVIRGPGATMWGANAVNGVISITTKMAADTQGGLFVADAGMGRPGEASTRFGGSFGKNAFYRLSARQTTRSSSSRSSGEGGRDSWNMTEGTFRLDWSLPRADSFTVEASAYRGVMGTQLNVLRSLSPVTYGPGGQIANSGGYVRARWNRPLSDSAAVTLQFSNEIKQQRGEGGKDLNITDIDLQHNFQAGFRHNIIWGAEYRRYEDDFPSSIAFSVTPPRHTTHAGSGFIQDEIDLARRKLFLTAGSKFEYSSFTSLNIQPTIRLSWLPTVHSSAWLAISRAVRSANRIERGVRLNVGSFPAGPGFGLVQVHGWGEARSEELIAYEAGYRYQTSRRLWVDTTAFYNRYDHLSTTETGNAFFETSGRPPHLVLPLYYGNNMRGETYGAEIAGNYKVSHSLGVRASYSLLRLALHGRTPDMERAEGQSPQHQVHVETSTTLPKSFEISNHIYFVSSLPRFQLPLYTRLDLNVAWRGVENLELALVGENLLGSHLEFGTLPEPANPVKRSIHGKISWRF